jgi:biofilm PGA synthesis N-glycosyltransferase PgaC
VLLAALSSHNNAFLLTSFGSPSMKPKYVVISPVRDEEKYIRFTLDSMIAQALRPTEWIIVNDGSKDATGKILDEYALEHPWIRPVHRHDRGFRKAGGGVVEAFYAGHRKLTCTDWDFIVKLDGDLTLAPDYFERALAYFEHEPRLGITGGTVYHDVNGKLEIEKTPKFHVRGASKIYKKECWTAIGGLLEAPGWDTIDELKSNMLGWTTKSLPDLHILHHRFTGTADGSWRGSVKNGRANYISGYHPLFVGARCVYRLFYRPYVVGAIGMFWGYASGYLMKIPRVDDPALIEYTQRQQLARLFGRQTIWR